jgi:hypothetical protein
MFFVNEAPLTEPVRGVSGFAAEFEKRGVRDRKGRSLKDLDLNRRFLRYPLSYLIYSEAFDALPGPAKDYFYERTRKILSGADTVDFRHLSAEDRDAIREILEDTKPDFRARSAVRPGQLFRDFPKPIFQREISRLQGIDCGAKLLELRLRPVHFEAHEVRKGQRFAQERIDIFQMMNCSVRVDISFAAVHFVSIKTPTVVQALRLRRGPGNESLAEISKRGHLSGMNLEVGNNRAASILCGHRTPWELRIIAVLQVKRATLKSAPTVPLS